MDKVIFDKLFDKYKPHHRREELHQLVNLLEWFEPKSILELGVLHGGTFGFWEYLIPSHGLLIGIDRLKNSVRWDWEASPKSVQYIQGNIDDEAVYKQVKITLDFLYIDANHFYEPVKRHFGLYSPLVRKDGIIAFHDIRDNKGSGYGVGKYFNELKEQYGWLEILVPGEDRGPGADGIGVIFK